MKSNTEILTEEERLSRLSINTLIFFVTKSGVEIDRCYQTKEMNEYYLDDGLDLLKSCDYYDEYNYVRQNRNNYYDTYEY